MNVALQHRHVGGRRCDRVRDQRRRLRRRRIVVGDHEGRPPRSRAATTTPRRTRFMIWECSARRGISDRRRRAMRLGYGPSPPLAVHERGSHGCSAWVTSVGADR